MRSIGLADVLALWERGAARHALDRSALLCAFARPELAPDAVVDMPLGEVAATLLHLREASFGPRIASHVDCEACGERLELALSTHELLQPVSAGDAVEAAGLRVRLPTLRDLAAVAHETDEARAARLLLARCTMHGDAAQVTDAAQVSDAAMQDIEDRLEALDPNADLSFTVHCPVCGHDSSAQCDPGVLLWDELAAHARTLLHEVHVLARAYGWSEGEILALGATRRAAYIAMVSA